MYATDENARAYDSAPPGNVPAPSFHAVATQCLALEGVKLVGGRGEPDVSSIRHQRSGAAPNA